MHLRRERFQRLHWRKSMAQLACLLARNKINVNGWSRPDRQLITEGLTSRVDEIWGMCGDLAMNIGLGDPSIPFLPS